MRSEYIHTHTSKKSGINVFFLSLSRSFESTFHIFCHFISFHSKEPQNHDDAEFNTVFDTFIWFLFLLSLFFSLFSVFAVGYFIVILMLLVLVLCVASFISMCSFDGFAYFVLVLLS